jgi:hypothetical protein
MKFTWRCPPASLMSRLLRFDAALSLVHDLLHDDSDRLHRMDMVRQPFGTLEWPVGATALVLRSVDSRYVDHALPHCALEGTASTLVPSRAVAIVHYFTSARALQFGSTLDIWQRSSEVYSTSPASAVDELAPPYGAALVHVHDLLHGVPDRLQRSDMAQQQFDTLGWPVDATTLALHCVDSRFVDSALPPGALDEQTGAPLLFGSTPDYLQEPDMAKQPIRTLGGDSPLLQPRTSVLCPFVVHALPLGSTPDSSRFCLTWFPQIARICLA